MSAKNCPHCNAEIPAEFGAMPVCFMCGGDLAAQPTQVWTALDIKEDSSRQCPRCQETIVSVLTLECPNCQIQLPIEGQKIPSEPAVAMATPEPKPPPESPPLKQPQPPKEGFLTKLLRMLGFK